jgi:hypothetical protein
MPADGEQEGKTGLSPSSVGRVHAFQHAGQRWPAAERADDRQVEVTVPQADIAPVEQTGEFAGCGVVQQACGLDVGVQQYRPGRTLLHQVEPAAQPTALLGTRPVQAVRVKGACTGERAVGWMPCSVQSKMCRCGPFRRR